MPDERELMSGTVFERADEPAYVMDPESDRILAANDAGCAMLGYTRAELLETPISRIHPSELPELSELLERVLRHGRASTIVLTCRTKTGTFLPTEISVHALEIGGRTRILGLVQDRSEHRRPVSVTEPEPGHSPETGAPGTLGGAIEHCRTEEENEVSTTTPPTVTQRGRVRVEHGAKRIRAYLGGELVADTTRPLLVWEKPYYPAYYFPAAEVRTELLMPDGVAHSPSRGDGRTFTVRAGGKEAAGAALRYEQSPFEELRDAIRLQWDSMDAWYEEDEQVFTHPRDPYTRVDILPSSRHVRIEADGITIAETEKPTLLFETGLRTRYYVPMTHVRMELLTRSETVSHCPYKGTAEYWSLRAGDELRRDVAWSYPTPLPESQKIAGLISFYPEKVAVYVDGELES